MEIGEKIKFYRNRLRMTQKELAEKSGLSENSIQKYEQGTRTPKLHGLKKIAKVLNIPVSVLTLDANIDSIQDIYPFTEQERAFINYLSSLNIKFQGQYINKMDSSKENVVRFVYAEQNDKYGKDTLDFILSLSKLEKFKSKIDLFIKELLPLLSDEIEREKIINMKSIIQDTEEQSEGKNDGE